MSDKGTESTKRRLSEDESAEESHKEHKSSEGELDIKEIASLVKTAKVLLLKRLQWQTNAIRDLVLELRTNADVNPGSIKLVEVDEKLTLVLDYKDRHPVSIIVSDKNSGNLYTVCESPGTTGYGYKGARDIIRDLEESFKQ